MTYSKDDRLIRMANQIAENLAAHGHEQASTETAQHILDYWDPAMRETILTVDQARLSRIALSAVKMIMIRQSQ